MNNNFLLFLENFINDPDQHQNRQKCEKIINIVSELCNQKQSTRFSFRGSTYCSYCVKINQTEDNLLLPCSHSVHYKCFVALLYKDNENFDPQKYVALTCPQSKQCASFKITDGFIFQNMPKLALLINSKRNSIDQKYAQQIIQRDEQERKTLTLNKKFTCIICTDDKLITKDCQTLDCDHMFCNECLNSYLQNLVDDGKFQENDICCPDTRCKKPITPQDIGFIVNKQLRDRIFDLRSKYLIPTDENQIFHPCSGWLIEQQGNFYPAGKKNQAAIPPGVQGKLVQCPAIIELNRESVKTQMVQCFQCKTAYCIFGCQDIHQGMNCEQFKEKLRKDNLLVEEGRNDQLFQDLVVQEKMKQCSKCLSWIIRNQGCNHMTCRRPGCGNEFCYICGGVWHNRRCGH